jgi:hypothetical protein
MKKSMKDELIAPCGMNCGICLAYLRKERRCLGCYIEDADIRPYLMRCVIRNCETIKNSESGFCYECEEYPCKRLKQLDKRYRIRYAMSMIENLENIREKGLSAFVEGEEERWRCPKCGGVICVHRHCCSECGEKVNS